MNDQHITELIRIFEQQIHTQSALNVSLAQMGVTLGQVNQQLETLVGKFSNGFRKEFTDEIKKVDAKVTTLISPGFWLKLGIGAIASVGTITAAIAALI